MVRPRRRRLAGNDQIIGSAGFQSKATRIDNSIRTANGKQKLFCALVVARDNYDTVGRTRSDAQ